jgi:mRNA interferase RelE/StbE
VKKVAYSSAALRSLRRVPRKDAQRIQDKIAQYAEDPTSQANNVKKLRGRDGLRLRVGDWRVIFDEDEDGIRVLVIGPRGSVYG